MPVTHSLEGRVLVIQPVGSYGVDELRAAWDRALREAPASRHLAFCLDVRRSTALSRRSILELRSVTNWFLSQARSVDNRCAIVARSGIQYGLMRMVSAWTDFVGVEVRVFRSRERALFWLLEQPPR